MRGREKEGVRERKEDKKVIKNKRKQKWIERVREKEKENECKRIEK